MVIKDDSNKKFEVCGQAVTDNAFTNKVYGMQRAGMNITAVVLPVTNRTSSKELISMTGYIREDGLYDRLQEEYRRIIRDSISDTDYETED